MKYPGRSKKFKKIGITFHKFHKGKKLPFKIKYILSIMANKENKREKW